ARTPNTELAAAGVWGRGSESGFFPERYPAGVAIPETQTAMVGYAESDDGLKWNRPNLDLIEWQGSRQNNMCFDGTGPAKQFDGLVTNLDSVLVVRDDASSDPQKRYKMINHWESLHCWDERAPNLDRPK